MKFRKNIIMDKHNKRTRQKESLTVCSAIVKNSLCVGCGICVAVCPVDKLNIIENEYGEYIPIENDTICRQDCNLCLRACPFWDQPENEDTIAQRDYSKQKDILYCSEMGYYLALFAGYVTSGQLRSSATSGGLIRWISAKLLSMQLVDAVICVDRSSDDDKLLAYSEITDHSKMYSIAKSSYYPVELSAVIKHMIENDKQYLVVGLPCFIKGLKLAIRDNEKLRNRMRFCISLICGHLKSKRYAHFLSRACGVDEENLDFIEFRSKNLYKRSSDYDCMVYPITGSPLKKPMKDVFATDWGLGTFKLNACDFCDDVYGETADLAVGDAWLSPYTEDPQGTCMLICRDTSLLQLLQKGIEDGELSLKPLSQQDAIKAQTAALRHRREGLAYRLFRAIKKGQWVPKKRVEPTNECGFFFKLIQIMRQTIRIKSHQAFRLQKSFHGIFLYKLIMRPYLFFYYSIYYVRNFIWYECPKYKKKLKKK